jgi:hypothetical protein
VLLLSCSDIADLEDPESQLSTVQRIDCTLPVSAPPAELGLDGFYTKYLDAGVPLVGSAQVDDAASPIACDIVSHMLDGRPDIVAVLNKHKIRVGIIAAEERLTDMPEYRDLDAAFPDIDWDSRARGLGATLSRPLVSCGEDNLLGMRTDWYKGEFILVHEFAHTMWLGVELLPGGKEKRAELEAAFHAAERAGTFANSYADTNPNEYWAEGVQAWFDTNGEAVPADGISSPINTRRELIEADARLSRLIAEVFADSTWRPTPFAGLSR